MSTDTLALSWLIPLVSRSTVMPVIPFCTLYG